MSEWRVGVLLTMGDYYGTVAATRFYGRHGIPVYLAEWRRFVLARWSRYVRETVTCPDVMDLERFGDWLVTFGEHRPGLFLYATSDDTVWLYASRREELVRSYRMYQPPLETVVQLLNKRKLIALCDELGIDYPETIFPDAGTSLASMPVTLRFPVLIKPTTQIGFLSHYKGEIATDSEELVHHYERVRTHNSYHPHLVATDPSVAWPIVQNWYKEAMDDIYSLTGFIDEGGAHFFTRAARKVFQRPRRFGVGLCFESAPVHHKLQAQVYDLCRRTGYYGAFEVEFIHLEDQERYLLIDFNPRFYGQMAFEIERELRLPALVYAATHPPARVLWEGAALAAASPPPQRAYRYANKWLLVFVLTLQWLLRRLSSGERQQWLAWYRSPEASYADAIYAPDDRLPYVLDILTNLQVLARHPQAFLRQLLHDR